MSRCSDQKNFEFIDISMKRYNRNLTNARKLMPANPRFQLLKPEPFKTLNTGLSFWSRFKYNRKKKHVYKHRFCSFVTFYKKCFENNLPVLITKESILEPICMSIMHIVKDQTVSKLLPKLKKIINILCEHINDNTTKVIRNYLQAVKECMRFLFTDEGGHLLTIKIELYSYEYCRFINKLYYNTDFEKYLLMRDILALEFKPVDQVDYMNLTELVELSNLTCELDEFKQMEHTFFGVYHTRASLLPKLDNVIHMPAELYTLLDKITHNHRAIYLQQIKNHIESTNYVVQKDILKYKFPDIEIENDCAFWIQLQRFIANLSSKIDCNYIQTYLNTVKGVIETHCLGGSLQQMLSTTGGEWDGWYFQLFYRKLDIHDRCFDAKNIRMTVQYLPHKQANYMVPSRKQKAQSKCVINFSK